MKSKSIHFLRLICKFEADSNTSKTDLNLNEANIGLLSMFMQSDILPSVKKILKLPNYEQII
jgi:hypothetical protein